MSDLFKKYNNLSDSKKALLDQLILKKHKESAETLESIQLQPGKKYPLSWPQERLWFLNKLYPQDSSYNLGIAFKIKGVLDIDKFKNAFKAIANKHKVLHTGFHRDGEFIHQVIEKDISLDVSVIDIKAKHPEKVALDQARHIIRTPFDLSKPPLLRLELFRIDKQFVFVFCIHHIICDAWSMNLIIRDLLSYYDKQRLSCEPPLQYIDYVYWQKKQLTHERLDRLMQFWQDYLNDAPELSTIPSDFKRSEKSSSECDFMTASFPQSLVHRINDFSKKRSYTVFQTLISVFALLLFHLYGQKKWLLGTAVSNRVKVEFEEIVGFFINTLILEFKFENQTIENWMNKTINRIKKAFSNQDIPYEKLLEQLKIDRSLLHNPLIQIMFNVQNVPLEKIDLSGCSFEKVPLFPRSQFDLVVNVYQQKHEWQLEIIYQTDLYSEQHIRNLFRHYFHLLDQVLDAPDQMLYTFNLVSNKEIKKRLQLENKEHLLTNDSIPMLFFKKAIKYGKNIAIAGQNSTTRYQELAERVAAVKLKLGKTGIKSGDRIAVMTRSDENHIPALLGVMAAGAVYLPIDQALPSTRIAYILKDANCKIILTDIASPIKQKKTDHQITFLNIPLDPGKVSRKDLSCTVKADDPAYLIYTSGTTGKPKGVLLGHKGFLSMILALIDITGMTSQDKHLRFFSSSFDGSLFEIFFTLFSGATLVLQNKKDLLHKDIIRQLILKKQVTSMNVPPSYMAQIGCDILSNLHILISAAEPALHASPRLKTSDCQYYNLYGPTEASVTATYYRVMGGEDTEKPIPIGKPIPNVKIIIVHPTTLQILPAGIKGEILIGGPCLAVKYINQPQLTKTKFVELEQLGHERFYRSGDIGYLSEEGILHFSGRKDDQVKVHGYRIELGEIEAIVDGMDAIRKCCAVVQTEKGISDSISLFYSADKKIDPKIIRSKLAVTLPTYMIPQSIQFVETFPLTVNGKIDKKRLPKPKKESTPRTETFCTENEKLLASCWEQVLHTAIKSRYDHFFNLGGDSLKIIHVISMLNKKGKHIEVKAFFQNPCLKDQALTLTQYQPTNTDSKFSGRVPMTPVQHWFFERVHIDRDHYNQTAMLLCHERMDIACLDKVLMQIIQSHDVFNLRYISHEQDYYQEYIPRVSVKPKLYILCSSANPEKSMTEKIEQLQHFQIDTPPLLKIAVFRLADADRLFIVMHHLICDFTSMHILIREIDKAYGMMKQNQSIQLVRSTSFGKWCKELVNYTQSESMERQKAFWYEQTSDYCFKLPGKIKYDKRHVNSKNEQIRLTREQTTVLLKKAELVHNNLQAVILAEIYRALGIWTGTDKVELCIAGHGREPVIPEPNLTSTLGWFSAIIPLKIHPQEQDKQDIAGYINRQIEHMPDNGLGYGLLRYVVRDSILLQRDLPETAFVFLGNMSGQMRLDHFSILPVTMGTPFSPNHERMYPLEISAIIIEGRLYFNIQYNTDKFERSEIEDFITWVTCSGHSLHTRARHVPHLLPNTRDKHE